MTTSAISIFFSYAHEDENLRDKLANHLSILKRQGAIAAWHDRQIRPGTEWDKQINHHLESAQIVLLLVSADFLASDYCWDVEVKRAIARHEAGEAKVIPIILRSVDWQAAPFGKLQALPKNALPITKWQDEDEALMTVAKSLREVVKEMAQSETYKRSRMLPSDATGLSLWVHGWKKYIFDGVPTVELDWTEYFDPDSHPRRIADQEIWDEQLLPSLEEAKTSFLAGSMIDIRGQLPLSAALAIGATFRDVERYTLRILQRTAGQDACWVSSAGESNETFQISEEAGQAGENLLIMLAIRGDAWEDTFQMYRQSSQFDAVVYAEPASGTGERAISSATDAVSLAIDAMKLILECRNRYHAKCVHLLLFCPQGFALFLGQRLRFVEVQTYEFDQAQGYVPSVRLKLN